MASLLEVGTGFHPDLTGRENVFLNGAILGMRREEIRQKFDEIVAFAEVERFLDTPVKRYSSGMYVRLAFAVAAHLEPEILIVDEVLAVGDAQFQDKCLGKIRRVAQGGRTVLFVTHNLATMQALCMRGVYLADGGVAIDGGAHDAAARYLKPAVSDRASEFTRGDPAIRLDHAEHRFENGASGIEIELTLRSSAAREVAIEFILHNTNGVALAFAGQGTLAPGDLLPLRSGEQTFRFTVDTGRLATGAYLLMVKLVHPMVAVLAVYEHPAPLRVNHPPRPPAIRNLELEWGVGAVELDLQRH